GYLLVTVLLIGAGTFLTSTSIRSDLPYANSSNLVIVDITMFVLAAAGLMWLYTIVFTFLNPGYLSRVATEGLLSTVRDSVATQLRSRMEDHLLREECNQLGLLYQKGARRWG